MSNSTAAIEAIPHAIICYSYGSYSLYAATVKNAMDAFETFESNLDPQVVAIAQAMDDTYPDVYISPRDVSEALAEIIELPSQYPAPKLRRLFYGRAPSKTEDLRPEVIIDASWQQELAVFMVKHGLTLDNLRRAPGTTLATLAPQDQLTFLNEWKTKLGRNVKYPYDDSYFTSAEGYRRIKKGAWKEGAPVERIVRTIVEYINENMVDTSDTKFDVSKISPTYS